MNAAIRILHLEDDPADARLIREQLRKSDLDVAITVADTREAFEAVLAKGGFNLVLSDYHVPGFNGLEALELVRSATAHMPFILVTGALGDERAVEVLRSGATDCVLKDRLARLAPAIQRALTEHAAQRQHEEVQARLTEAHRLSKLAADAARMGTWQLHVATGKLDCSEEFLNLIGVRRADWAGTINALDALMHPEDVERRRRLHVEAVRHGRFMELEFRIPKPDGEVRWMYLRGDCSFGTDGAPAIFLGVMMDITERRQMEEALRDADRRKDEFLATLAHELRNPLAPIHNGLSVLRQSAVRSSEADHIHAMLERQMNHIIRLVDDLLDVSRYTLGKIELKRAPVELQTVVHNAIEMSQPLIEASRHRLDVSVPSDPVTLDADGVRLAQVLSNLLNNAAKYTGEGGQLWLSARVQEDRAVISVRDTGVGIPESMLDRVFDLFTQVDGDDSLGRPGLGIGLAMVRVLAELHGGEVEARSAGPGQGSEFIVRLPVSAAQYVSGTKGSAVASDASLSGRRVLVVDDNCDSADSLGMLLKLAGADAHVAYDGASALAAIPIHQPHVVLLDIGMPGMDGYTVASRIREDSRYRDMTLIALTGFGQEQDRLRSLAAGFNHHLTKPADLNALQALLASLEPVEEARPTVRNP
jgi:PAS domain S-box-containing protein